jgi:hypothetical protein
MEVGMDISNAKCPECGKPMMPVVCLCGRCNVRLEGEFEVSALARLSSEDQALAMAFIRSFGSIKSLQESLGVSYPTARNRLEALVAQLDKAMAPPNPEGENPEDAAAHGRHQGLDSLKDMGRQMREGFEPLKDMGRRMREGLEPLRDMRRQMREGLRPLKHMKKDIRRHVRTHIRGHAPGRADVNPAELEEKARRASEVLRKLEAGEIDVKQALEEL